MAASLVPAHSLPSLRDENARLRAELRAMQVPATKSRTNPPGWHCGECGYWWADGQSEHHRDSCRTRMSRRALGELH